MSEGEALKNQEFICAYCIGEKGFKCDDYAQYCEDMNKLKTSYGYYLERKIEQLQRENEELKEALEDKRVCYYNNKAYDCKLLIKKAKTLNKLEKALKDHRDIKIAARCGEFYVEVDDVLDYLTKLKESDSND